MEKKIFKIPFNYTVSYTIYNYNMGYTVSFINVNIQCAEKILRYT